MFEEALGGQEAWKGKSVRLLAKLHLRATALNHEIGGSRVRPEETHSFVTASAAIIKKFEAATGIQVRRRAEIILRDARGAGAGAGGGSLAEWKEEERRRQEAARQAVRGDAAQEEESSEEDEDEEQTEAMIKKLAGTVKQFKGAAAQNFNDLEASHDALDSAMAALIKNIPKASALRRDLNEYMVLLRKEGAVSFYSKLLMIGGTLAYVYIRIKMKG